MKKGSIKLKRRANQAAIANAIEALKPESGLTGQMVQARLRAGLTQAELALQMGTTQSAIARLESGRCSPSIATLRKIAAATRSRLVMRLDEV
jgi:DNA-binding XRE family transcriptional regulator